MPKASPSPLANVGWLQKHLRDKKLRVVDFRWYLQGKEGATEYAAGHIPGAVFVDLELDLTPKHGPGRHPAPSPEQFTEAMQAAGINDDTRVIVYDDVGGSIAARLWFLFELYGRPGQAQVLDGGLQAWVAAGGELETAMPQHARGDFEAQGMRRSLLDKHDVERLRRAKDVLLLDARAAERYRGDVEPVDARPGHIPGAKSAPWSQNLADGRFKSAKELRAQYKKLGVGPKTEVVAYCGSGVTACHDLIALQLAGVSAKRVHLYEGSWSDWARDPFRPAVLGEELKARR
ncbi:MAG: sulfurtransferase [Deltaproteobacteria bacterium]|nr:sulfurtransferase [Deltaproteobacteria bacterium]